jgi:AcrR family transcriptional regulator
MLVPGRLATERSLVLALTTGGSYLETPRGHRRFNVSAPTQDRREEVLQIATRLFYEHGFQSVGIRMIADAVGIQPSSLYYHFPSKEEILFKIALRATKDFVESLTETLRNPGDRVESLKSIVRHYVTYFAEHQLVQRVVERESRELTSVHRKEIRERQRSYVDQLTDFVTEAADEGILNVRNPAIATRASLDMLNHFSRWFEPRPGMGIDEFADLYAELIVDGMLGARR